MTAAKGAMMWRYTPTNLTIQDADGLIEHCLQWTTDVAKRGEVILPRMYPTPTGSYVLVRSPYGKRTETWDVYMITRDGEDGTARVVYQTTHDRKLDAEITARTNMRIEWPEGQAPKWVRRVGK